MNERRIPGAGRIAGFSALEKTLEPRLRDEMGKELQLGDFTLGEETARRVGDQWFINYELRRGSIPLSPRSYADVVVGLEQADVRTLRTRNVPIAGVDGETPTVARQDAVAVARRASAELLSISADSPILQNTDPTLAYEAGSTEKEPAQLCWLVTVFSTDAVRAHRIAYSVKAIGEPVVLYKESLVKDDHHGTVRGSWWDVTPTQTAVSGPLPYALVRRTVPNASANADANGAYKLAGAGQAEMTGTLRSNYFRVSDLSGSGNLVASAAGDSTAPINLAFSGNGQFEIAQSSAFFWAHRARDFIGGVLSPNDLKGTLVLANLNATCNASFEAAAPAVLRLFRAGPSADVPGRQCVNRAYADTIFHEFGHGVDWVLKGFTDDAYAEGFSDAIAILFTRSHCYGRDSYQDASGQWFCLRPANNPHQWPGKKLSKHDRGSIYSGFVFDLVSALRTTMTDEKAYGLATQLTLQAAAQNPRNIKDAVYRTLLADKSSKGFPHYSQIKKAAMNKGIWDPSWP